MDFQSSNTTCQGAVLVLWLLFCSQFYTSCPPASSIAAHLVFRGSSTTLQVCILLAFLCQEKEALLSQLTQEQLTERHSHTGAVMLARKTKPNKKHIKSQKKNKHGKRRKLKRRTQLPGGGTNQEVHSKKIKDP